MLIATAQATMSSREIAELTDKRHDNVMRDIRAMLVELHGEGGVLSFEDTQVNPQNGQSYPVYRLPKRETLILVSGYNLAMRSRIIDRWQELEAGQKPAAELTRMEILKLAMESEQARIQAEAERDEAVRTKAQIGSRREATAMATASAAKAEASRLKEQLGACSRHASVRAVHGRTGIQYDWLPMRRWCKREGMEPREVIDPLFGTVKAWPAAAWRGCHGIDLAALFGQGNI